MRIGYACLMLGNDKTGLRTCTMKNASEEKLYELISHNLNSLETMIDYNIENHISLYRISSDLIPFGSSCVNQIAWESEFSDRFALIASKIKNENLRISMHPGQYTVLNSPDEKVVERAILDLNYHAKILNLLDADQTNKIVLHVGGVYQSKEKAIERFIENFAVLDNEVKKRLILENDDKLYHIKDILTLSERLGIPVVYDNLHNITNCYESNKSDLEWILECKQTWKIQDGNQKIHYSQQADEKRKGSHSSTISIKEFEGFYQMVKQADADIMLEVKDKNLSTMKCLNYVTEHKKMRNLEKEWERYQYLILEKSAEDYKQIRQLLKDKTGYPVLEFYQIIEKALNKEESIGNAVNAAQYVWEYFSELASFKEKEEFLKKIASYQKGSIKLAGIKSFLWKMTKKYPTTYLEQSLYFYL